MPLEAQMIPQTQIERGTGWMVVWERDEQDRAYRAIRHAHGGLLWVYETHFVTCPGKVPLEKARKMALTHRWFKAIWEHNGGAEVEGMPPVEEAPELPYEEWINQDWSGGVEA